MEKKYSYDEEIRSKLSSYEPAYNAADWKSMERILDRDRDKGIAWIKPLFAILLLSSAGLGLAFYLSDRQSNRSQNEPDKSGKNIAAVAEFNSSSEKSTAASASRDKLLLTEKVEIESAENAPSVSESTQKESFNVAVAHQSKNSGTQSKTAEAAIEKKKNNTGQIVESPLSSSLLASSSNELALSISESQQPLEGQSLVAELKEEEVSDVPAKKKDILPKKKKSAFSIQAGAGVSSALLNKDRLSSLTPQASLLLSADISKNFGLKAGIGYEKLSYVNNHPVADTFRAAYDVPRQYHSEIQKLSFPVAVQYDFLSKGKNKLGVQAGVVVDYILSEEFSYDMGSQGYDSVYDKSNNSWIVIFHDTIAPPLKTDFSTGVDDAGNAAIHRNDFSNTNNSRIDINVLLAMTYERLLSKRLSVIAQPQIKISSSKLGIQDKVLLSPGMQIFVRYHF